MTNKLVAHDPEAHKAISALADQVMELTTAVKRIAAILKLEQTGRTAAVPILEGDTLETLRARMDGQR